MSTNILADISISIPESFRDLTFQTVQILKEAYRKGIVSFQVDDSETAIETVRQLSIIVPRANGYFLRENEEYNLINWQGNNPKPGKYFVIFDEIKNENNINVYW